MLQHIARQGGFTNAIRMDAGLREGVYLYNGILTKNVIADKLGLIARDINLLIAAMLIRGRCRLVGCGYEIFSDYLWCARRNDGLFFKILYEERGSYGGNRTIL